MTRFGKVETMKASYLLITPISHSGFLNRTIQGYVIDVERMYMLEFLPEATIRSIITPPCQFLYV